MKYQMHAFRYFVFISKSKDYVYGMDFYDMLWIVSSCQLEMLLS